MPYERRGGGKIPKVAGPDILMMIIRNIEESTKKPSDRHKGTPSGNL